MRRRKSSDLKLLLSLLRFIFLGIGWFFRRFVLKKYQNADGYVYSKNDSGKILYEHREIAEKILGRRLTRYEVVHHINGKTDDNDPANLCVMDSIEHDRFHKWCEFIHKTYNRYPRRDTQLKKLKESFKGILLTEVSNSKYGAS